MTMDAESVPPWIALVDDALRAHLKTFADPELEMMPHPRPEVERGACGVHAAFQTERRHFCLFFCCAKTLAEACFKTLKLNSEEEEEDYEKRSAKRSSPRHARLARLGLVVHPEDYRCWNSLKTLQPLDVEVQLRFAYFLQTKYPRSSEIFCHLRFLTRRVAENEAASASSLTDVVREGLEKCSEAATRYRGNYHAWDHRRYLVDALLAAEERDSVVVSQILRREMDVTTNWIRLHVSDACPFKYRLFLVETCRRRGAGVFAGIDFSFIRDLRELDATMRVYPGHETLWNHRRDLHKLSREMQDGDAYENFAGEDRELLKELDAGKNDWELTLEDRYVAFLESLAREER